MGRMETNPDSGTRVSVRVPESLKEDYRDAVESQGSNMTEDIREHMKAVVDDHGGPDDQLPDGELGDAYRVLAANAGLNNRLPVEDAETLLSDKTNVPKATVRRRLLDPLRDQNLIRVRYGTIIVRELD